MNGGANKSNKAMVHSEVNDNVYSTLLDEYTLEFLIIQVTFSFLVDY